MTSIFSFLKASDKDASISQLKRIWEAHSDTFKRFMHEEQQQFPDKKGKKPTYIDSKGKAYYNLTSFTLEPPLERVAKGQDFLMMMSQGLSSHELNELIEVATSEMALAWAGKKNNAPVTVGAVFKAMQERSKMLLHIDLFYEYFAVYMIREDEEVGHFNQLIHEEKVKQFKEDNRGKNSFFFFQIPETKRFFDAMKCTESEWMQQCEESQRQINALKEWIQLIKNKSIGAKKSEILKPTEMNT